MGHKVHTPNLPGHGKDKNKSVKHTDYVKSVVNYVKERNLKDFVLVGHSFGGTVISKVAEQIPDRIKRLVFMDAFVLADGNSVADEIPAEGKQLWTELTKKSKDHAIQLPFPIWRETFMNNADLSLAKKFMKQSRQNLLDHSLRSLISLNFISQTFPKAIFT